MAMRANADDHRGYYQAAMILCKMCDYKTALGFIDLAITKNPDNFKAILNRIYPGLSR